MASADRSRRRIVTCAACGQRGEHRGHGYCITCYTRWVYHGRPAGGPPKPGQVPRKPAERKPVPVPEFCKHHHRLDGANLRFTRDGVRYCRACRYRIDRAYMDRLFDERHDGHDVIPTVDGRRYCRTCNVGAHDVDEIAVERAASGDRPERLSPAEREAAVVQLRLYGLPYWLIAERVGCCLETAWLICKRNGMTQPRPRRKPKPIENPASPHLGAAELSQFAMGRLLLKETA